LSPEYFGEAGMYSLILTDPDNYVIVIPEAIILYVNPFGPGTRAVRPVLDCVEELFDHESGFQFIAHFRYENENDEVVYIPEGENNHLNAEGQFQIENLVEAFLPGEGYFNVLFDGSKLVWEVTSREEGHYASVGSEASSGSSKCHNNKKSMQANSFSSSESLDTGSGILVYPNPASERVFVRLNGNVESENVMIIDFLGKSYPVHADRININELEIDLNGMIPGLYMLRIKTEGMYEVVHFVIQ
jgi:hypothetical protein